MDRGADIAFFDGRGGRAVGFHTQESSGKDEESMKPVI